MMTQLGKQERSGSRRLQPEVSRGEFELFMERFFLGDEMIAEVADAAAYDSSTVAARLVAAR